MKKPQTNVPPQGIPNNSVDEMLQGGGEMGALIRALDWSKTSLGAIEHWPQSLQTAVSICLFSRFPIHIWWGAELIEIYNDAYRPILGTNKHPQAMGQRGQETWSEIWHIIGPMLESVYHEGKGTWSSDQMLPMDRHGYTEEAYFTFSYSPIFDETGGVGGIFTVVTETTKSVLGQRRLKTLHDLGERTSAGKTTEEACQLAAEILAENTADIPFALLYLLEDDEQQARLIDSYGVDPDSQVKLSAIPLSDERETGWSLSTILANGQIATIDDLDARFDIVPQGPWAEKPQTALILPIASSTNTRTIGFLIVGVSARLALDDDYRHFFELVVGHIATAIARARAYEEERARAEALAELDRAKTEFFSNISHEFRTPLTLMLNPLQSVLDDPHALTPTQRENLEVAHRNSLRLLKLVNTLLDFSRIQANRIQASFEPTDLAMLTADLASNFRSTVERAGLRLMVDCPPLPELVYVDREMWEKIVLNLLSNAFKFTFEGEIVVSIRAHDDHAELTVRDSGIGISEADLPTIFERFHRVLGARSRTHEGSGIGLALVNELVHFHNGQIAASSQVGVGTTFTISIPFGFAHLPQEQINVARTLASTAIGAVPYVEEARRWLIDDITIESDEPPISLTNVETAVEYMPPPVQRSDSCILVVDDNADMRDYLRRLLHPHYEVETANDGIAALTCIRERLPDLVITDVMMPNLDGYGFLQQLRADAGIQTIPVILLSARADETAQIEGLQAGAADYLTKPFSARELLARVDAQLKMAQLRRKVMQTEREAQATIETIVESIAEPFYALDRDWRFVYVNQHAQQMWGKSREELLGSNIWELFPHDPDGQAYQAMHRAAEEQRPMRFETLSKFLHRWVEINIYPSPNGIAVYFRDISERKRSQEAIQVAQAEINAERQRIVTIFESISDAFVVLDQDFRFSYLNRQAIDLYFKLTGKDEAYFLGHSVWETFPGSYETPFGEAYRRAMRENVVVQFQDLYTPLNVWFDIRVYPSSEGLSIYFADITEYHKTQIALRETEERLRLIIDSAKDYAIFALDPLGIVTNWNAGAERVFGYEEAEIIGQSGEIIFTPEDRVRNIPEYELQKALDVGYSEDERWHLRKDGTRFYASGTVRPIFDVTGIQQGFAKVARDTTERKLAEQRTELLQQFAAELSSQLTIHEMAKSIILASMKAVNGAAGSIFLLSSDGNELERVFTEGILQSTQTQFTHIPLDVPVPVTDCVRDRQIVWIETMAEYIRRYPHIQDQIVQNNFHAVICIPLMLEQQILGGLSISFHAIPHISSADHELLVAIAHLCAHALERARLYTQEQQARQVAQEADALKLKFLGMISHELRTPLASIKGFASSLLETDITFSPDEQQQFLTIIDEETDKLTDLVEQLLDLSRLQAGTLRIEPTLQTLDTVINAARIQLQTLTERHMLVMTVPNTLPLIVADTQRIAQVLVNLVGNAVKFSPPATPITVVASSNLDTVQIDVSDQGMGIPKEERDKVFEAFRQVERKTPNERHGAGLGLAICKGIVEAHSGRIWIHDQPAGTTISFTLPTASLL